VTLAGDHRGSRVPEVRGVNALFVGASGTGKSMAAEVVADALELDWYRIDLAAVVSKWIGETERNLERLFDARPRTAKRHSVLRRG
jgi:SpoVK/Ycf46/Vps4 family AAA+-type ATPase